MSRGFREPEAATLVSLDIMASKRYSLCVDATDSAAEDRVLTGIAGRLIWWMASRDALDDRQRFVAQVMALGTDRDVDSVEAQLGSEVFDRVLDHPPAGLFSSRRWNYWHVRQRRSPVPPLPRRFPR